jgi:hypothetical protein
MVAPPPEPSPPPEREPSPPGAVTAEEAAAIAAALDRFLHDTAPAPASASIDQASEQWTRAAMLEGVTREDHAAVPHPWINT